MLGNARNRNDLLDSSDLHRLPPSIDQPGASRQEEREC
jgi:hypothetical protein